MTGNGKGHEGLAAEKIESFDARKLNESWTPQGPDAVPGSVTSSYGLRVETQESPSMNPC